MTDRKDPHFSGGSQPVQERPTPVPGPGRGAMQYVVIAIAAFTILAGLVFFFRDY